MTFYAALIHTKERRLCVKISIYAKQMLRKLQFAAGDRDPYSEQSRRISVGNSSRHQANIQF